MKKLSFLSILALLASCGVKQSADFTITVRNDQTYDREELVEVPISDVAKKVKLIDEEQYIVLDAEGNQLGDTRGYDLDVEAFLEWMDSAK